LVTTMLVIVFIVAIIEFVLAAIAPKLVGSEQWPQQSKTPTRREWIYCIVGIVCGMLAMIIYVIGANYTYAEIGGAQLHDANSNMNASSGSTQYNNATSADVDLVLWRFQGAHITVDTCPLFYCDNTSSSGTGAQTSCPNSGIPTAQCTSFRYSWTNAPWPYCPVQQGDAYIDSDGNCIKFAYDNIINALLFLITLIICPIATIKICNTVYRRLPLLHAWFMLAGMFLNLIWRREESFMNEILIQMFQPANGVILPYALAMNPESEIAWKVACTLYWVFIGILGVVVISDLISFYKSLFAFKARNTRFQVCDVEVDGNTGDEMYKVYNEKSVAVMTEDQ
jgi:hypothetical protein